MIHLKPIDDDNFRECISLTVREDQKNFVATNIYSLAQAWVHHDIARPFAVYNGDVMVGFTMLSMDAKEKECWVWRFMIDAKYQGKGYGKGAMAAVLAYIKQYPIYKTIHLSYEPENLYADNLYRSYGFLPTGEVEDGEIVMALKL